MNALEAKDFLVRQTEEQALLEHVPLSDLEKRMMYFTESGEMREDPLELNTAFEAEYDTDDYEAKTGKLMRHAYRRLQKENPEFASQWKQAIKKLSAGDHYLSVLWNAGAAERPPYDSLKLLGTALLVIVVGMAVILAGMYFSDRYGIHWTSRGGTPATYRPMPVWLQRSLIGTVVVGYFYFVVVPWIVKRPVTGLGQLFLRFLRRKTHDSSRE